MSEGDSVVFQALNVIASSHIGGVLSGRIIRGCAGARRSKVSVQRSSRSRFSLPQGFDSTIVAWSRP